MDVGKIVDIIGVWKAGSPDFTSLVSDTVIRTPLVARTSSAVFFGQLAGDPTPPQF
jgi:hypothetical protein